MKNIMKNIVIFCFPDKAGRIKPVIRKTYKGDVMINDAMKQDFKVDMNASLTL
jgi:hypothetical protein